ncbi:MAG: DUF3467 domain-containing protein [Tidjanibacter sp.]|nr:DUF3467 domain-containing protein [Tidjanibacter sp.]
MANENQQQRMEIELDAETAQGKYSNLAIISHSPSEFVLDFAAVLPGVQKAKVKSRIILTPEHAKALMMSLQENVACYERNVGEIKLNKVRGPQGGFNMGQA